MSGDALRKQVEEWLDNLRIEELVRERDALDVGERVELDDLIRELGFDPDALRGAS